MKIVTYTNDYRFRASPGHGEGVSNVHSPNLRVCAPLGAAAIIMTNYETGNNPRIKSEKYDFPKEIIGKLCHLGETATSTRFFQ